MSKDDELHTEIGVPDPDDESRRVPNTMLPFNYDPFDARNDWLANAAAGGNKRARVLIWATIVIFIVVPALVALIHALQ